ncbi:hypothetical protein OHA25_37275 [Nonomuraea sp. NBC_00507]|uniref:hypothetical protein n=1 Tax=Nonomuraea sp. NBC_00507 TaxID=2976002 RepID=UPI002E19002B
MRLMIALLLWLNPLPGAVQPRFPVPIDFCSVVDAGLVERLVPDAKVEHEGIHCVWAGRGVGLQVRPVGPNGEGSTWTSEQLPETYGTDKDVEPWSRTSAQTHEIYRTRHADDLRPSELTIWSDPAIGVMTANRRDATTTAARALEGVGDEAHEVDFLTIPSKRLGLSTKRLERVEVVFRVGNVLLEVGYTGIDGRVSANRLRRGAVEVSKRMATAFERMSPPERTAAPPPGIFTETPLACATLTAAQIKKLKAGSIQPLGSHPSSCHWGALFKDPRLVVQLWAPRRGPAGDGIAQAKEMVSHWKTDKSVTVGIAHEALADGNTVIFRKANLIGRIEATNPARAEQAARWIVAGLS